MINIARNKGNASIFLIIFIAVIIFNSVLGGLCVEYVVEYWMSKHKGISVDYPFLPCAIAGLFLCEIAIPAAIVTWFISLMM